MLRPHAKANYWNLGAQRKFGDMWSQLTSGEKRLISKKMGDQAGKYLTGAAALAACYRAGALLKRPRLGDWIGFAALIVGLLTLWVAKSQLTEANSSLRAANTLTLAREEREIAERIKDAKDDPDQQLSAYTRYGDHVAYAGYLHDRRQIDDVVWEDVRAGFCKYLETNPAFDLWYHRNISSARLTNLYPSFSTLSTRC